MMREEGGRDKVTAPLAIAITLALVSQFLNGYNTAVLNAVSQVYRQCLHHYVHLVFISISCTFLVIALFLT